MLAGIAMTVVFAAVYLRITPVEELRLIKNGSLPAPYHLAARWWFLSDTGFKYCPQRQLHRFYPVGPCRSRDSGFFVYFAATMMIRGATAELIGNNVAVGALFGAVSISIGILNAACLTLILGLIAKDVLISNLVWKKKKQR